MKEEIYSALRLKMGVFATEAGKRDRNMHELRLERKLNDEDLEELDTPEAASRYGFMNTRESLHHLDSGVSNLDNEEIDELVQAYIYSYRTGFYSLDNEEG